MFHFVPYLPMFFILLETVISVPQPYLGYKVLNIIPGTEEQLHYLVLLANSTDQLENIRFWNVPKQVGTTTTVDVSEKGFQSLKNILQDKNITFWISIDDLQSHINAERKRNEPQGLSNKDASVSDKFDFGRYHPLEEIDAYIESLKTLKEDVSIEVKLFGQSLEGRPLKAVEIKRTKDSNKPIMLIDAGIHAREWISPAAALYIISKLIRPDESSDEEDLLENFDWIIIPVLNPDGYVYSWTKDRLWRKNRRIYAPVEVTSSRCNGVDLNRNYDVGFTDSGSAGVFCSDHFGGIFPFSEPETAAFRDYVTPLKNRIKFYLTLHNYMQIWLTPYIYKQEYSSNYNKLNIILSKATAAMQNLNGHSYDYGPGSVILYSAQGSSVDWFYEKLNVTYAMALELPDKGEFGFLLPNDQILPIGRELWEALKVIASEIS